MQHPASLPKNFSCSFEGSFRQQEGEELSPPSGLALTPEGSLVVADDFNHRIQIYDKERKLTACFGGKGKNDGQFMYPRGMAVDADGNIYVADSWNHRVQKFDARGKHLLTIGKHGEAKGELNEPYDVLIDSTGRIVVVERYNHRIQFFDPDGTSLGWVGNRGTVLEEQLACVYETPAHLLSLPVFEFPTSIAADSRGNFYVTDSSNHRIVKFNSEWQVIQVIGEKGAGPGQFQYPLCISVGPNDLLYVADLNNDRVQVFTSQGQFLFAFDEADGSTKLKTPCLTLVDPSGRLYVGLTFNPTLLHFQTPVQPQDDLYKNLIEAQPEDFKTFFYQGRLHEETGSVKPALEAYTKAVSLLLAQKDQHSSSPSSSLKEEYSAFLKGEYSANFDEAMALPLRLCRLAPEGSGEREIEPLLLQCLDFYESRVQAFCREILDHKNRWDKAGEDYFRKLVAEETLILNQQEDPLVFNKDLYLAEKQDKTLFREIRVLFYCYRKVAEQRAAFVLGLLQGNLSEPGLKKCIETLKSGYRAVCGHISALLDNKEKNEEELVRAFAAMEGDQNQWANFHSKFQINSRTMETLRHFQFELRVGLKNIKCAALKYKGPLMEETLRELFIESPDSALIPKILLRIQEDWIIHPVLEMDHKDLLDTWLTCLRDPSSAAVRRVGKEFFSSVPFDVEDLNPDDIVRTLLMEGAPPERVAQGVLCGNEIFSLESVENDGEESAKRLQGVLDNMAVYEQKAGEIFKEMESFTLKKAELEAQLRQANPRDKKEPIPIRNNIEVIDFQISLFKRMIKTLEINEMNNFIRLGLGCALPALQKPIQAQGLFNALRAFSSELRKKTRDAMSKRKTVFYEKASVETEVQSDTSSVDLAAVDRSVQMKSRQIEIAATLERLEATLNRYYRINNLLDKLLEFASEGEDGAGAMGFQYAFGGAGPEAGSFFGPAYIAHTSQGDVLVVDQVKHQVQRFSAEGIYLSHFGCWGNSYGAFQWPEGVQVDTEDYIYVMDRFNYRVQKFTSEGKFVRAFGDRGEPENRIGLAFSLSIDRENNVWVADTQNHRIQIYTSDGKYLRSISRKGKNAQDLFEPLCICCLENGDYIVGDKSEYLLKRFNSGGELLHALKKDDPSINEIYTITHDPRHGIFAVDLWNHKIYQLNSKLEPIFTYQNPGRRGGQCGITPGLSIHQDTLMIADYDNQRILAFELKGTS